MKIARKSLFVALAGIFAAGVVHAQAMVKIDGSSTVYPVAEAVAEEFQKAKKGAVRVTVGISGTGGGFRKFCRGEIDIANASRPISKREMEECAKAGIRYIEMPAAFDALSIVVHPSNTWAANLRTEQLRVMWEPAAQGKINNWRQVDPSFPDLPLTLYGPGSDSGTFEYFTEVVNGKAKASRGDFTASEDDNVLVQGVSRDRGGLGYFGLAYFIENKARLRAVNIWNGKTYVEPSSANVENGSYAPMARPLFIYVNAASVSRPEVREFVQFFMDHGAKLTREVKFVPLPASVYKGNIDNMNRMRVGTVFGGVNEVGAKVEEIVRREARL